MSTVERDVSAFQNFVINLIESLAHEEAMSIVFPLTIALGSDLMKISLSRGHLFKFLVFLENRPHFEVFIAFLFSFC